MGISCCGSLPSLLSWLKPTVYYQMDVVLLGLPNSGKTSLINALTKGKVDSDMIPTMSMEISKFTLDSSYSQRQMLKRQQQQNQIVRRSKSTNFSALETDRLLDYEDSSSSGDELQYYPERLYIKCYDLSGQFRYQNTLWESCITSRTNCNLIIYVLDVSDELNLLNAKQKLMDILLLNNDPERGGKSLPVLIIGNKMDLVLDNFHTFLGGFLGNSTNSGSSKANSAALLNNPSIPADNSNGHKSNNATEMEDNSSESKRRRRRRSVMLGSKYKATNSTVLANNIAISSKLNISRSETLAQFLGIEVDCGDDEIHLNVNSNGSFKPRLEFDIGVFTVSLKYSSSVETGIEGYDTLDDVKDWIFGAN